jgi:hypothetical protein
MQIGSSFFALEDAVAPRPYSLEPATVVHFTLACQGLAKSGVDEDAEGVKDEYGETRRKAYRGH